MDLSGAVFAAMLFVWRDVCDVKDGDLVQHGFVWLLCVWVYVCGLFVR